MVSITLSLPAEIKGKMKQFPEMNWSGFIRKAIEEKTGELTWRQEMLKRLGQERDVTEWSVNMQRKSRAGRLQELRGKGLV